MVWRTLSRLILLALVGAVFVYSAAILVSVVNFYLSKQTIDAEDVRVLEDLTSKLDDLLQKQGTLAAAQTPIGAKNEDLRKAINGLRQANTQSALVSQLDTISANLSFLSEILKNKRERGSDLVAQLGTKVKELREKAGSPVGADKIAATFLREGGKILIAVIWPVLFGAIFLYLLNSRRAPQQLRKLLRPLKSVKLFEAELVLSDEVKVEAEGAFDDYRRQAKDSYDLFVQRKKLVLKFRDITDEVITVIKQYTNRVPEKYRCTLHVPDVVFADTLYQLLDYTPSGPGSRGRIFSIRFGLIGKVWRTRESEVQKVKLKEIMVNGQRQDIPDEEELVRVWGMSQSEAQTAAQGRPSFLCVMLATDENDPVGLFYMDATNATAFDVTSPNATVQMLNAINEKFKEKKIIEILAKMSEELGGSAPLIRIYEK
jgi:hypothetical protein